LNEKRLPQRNQEYLMAGISRLPLSTGENFPSWLPDGRQHITAGIWSIVIVRGGVVGYA
jgi:hypothetical protein